MSGVVGLEGAESLDSLGLAAGADSSSLVHNYLVSYEKFLPWAQDDEFTLLFIGNPESPAVEVWKTYFQSARIVVLVLGGIPVETSGQNRVLIEVKGRNDGDGIREVANRYHPSLVIDDGSHIWAEQELCFRNLFPTLQAGGLYVIEDVQTCFGEYAERYGSTTTDSPYSWIMQMASNLAAGVSASAPTDSFEDTFRSEVESVTVRRQLLLIKKRSDTFRFHEVVDLLSTARDTVCVPEESYFRVAGTLISASERMGRIFEDFSMAGEPVGLHVSGSGIVDNAELYGFGLVLDENGRIINESLNCFQNTGSAHGFEKVDDLFWKSRMQHSDIVHVPRAVGGRQHVLLKSAWDRNYGHWLVDSYAKLCLLRDIDYLEKPIFVINPQKGAMRQVVLDSLSLAGFAEEDCLEVDVRPHRFDSLLVLGSVSRHPTLKHPRAVRFLEEIAERVSPLSIERVYLTRNSYGRRSLVNEDEIWPEFERRGFVRVVPEELTLLEQIALFRGVKWVAGNMGAAFSNLLFAPQGVSAIMLATQVMGHDFFYDIICHKKGSYFAIQGTTVDEVASMSSDFVVNIDDVRSLLNSIDF